MKTSKMYGDTFLEALPGETEVTYWQRQNKHDKAIGLYCQSCCYRYPEECSSIETLHPYDRAAETCSDFIPKDYYKPKNKAKCWLKRLEVDPDWSPLPDSTLRHPIDWYIFVPSSAYYKVMSKMKVYSHMDYLQKIKEVF